MDLEWSVRDGKIFWLQARPVTSMGKKEQRTEVCFIDPDQLPETEEGEESWTSMNAREACPTASAVVVEVGSILSHGAVVAREIGIPAVMGVQGIIPVLNDGDTLMVDGSNGVVEIFGPEDSG
ncbi:MAG: PEP-utilizing enzyme [Vulcanimicrobiota bacterium]